MAVTSACAVRIVGRGHALLPRADDAAVGARRRSQTGRRGRRLHALIGELDGLAHELVLAHKPDI